jgi:MFS superfamily sulfate permease-like transporter
LLVLYRASRPYVARIGKLPGDRATYVDLERHPHAEAIPGLLMLRIDAPLYFFNVNVARSAILEALADSDPRPSTVLLDIGATADFDVTTADIVRQMIVELHEQSIEVLLAQVKGPVRDRMRKMGMMEMVGEDRVYLSVAAAVADHRRRSVPGELTPSGGPVPGEG